MTGRRKAIFTQPGEPAYTVYEYETGDLVVERLEGRDLAEVGADIYQFLQVLISVTLPAYFLQIGQNGDIAARLEDISFELSDLWREAHER